MNFQDLLSKIKQIDESSGNRTISVHNDDFNPQPGDIITDTVVGPVKLLKITDKDINGQFANGIVQDKKGDHHHVSYEQLIGNDEMGSDATNLAKAAVDAIRNNEQYGGNGSKTFGSGSDWHSIVSSLEYSGPEGKRILQHIDQLEHSGEFEDNFWRLWNEHSKGVNPELESIKQLAGYKNGMDENMAVMAPPSSPEGGAGAADECAGTDMPPKAAKPGLANDDELLIGEKGMEECDCDDKEMSGGPQVSIRSLIAALQAIEQGTEPEGHHDHEGEVTVYGMDEVNDGDFQDATTAPGEEVAGVNAVIPTGDDLGSKGVEKLKVNGGGNPMQESIVNRLQSMYDEIKSR
jgi:hypothetical protein